LPHKSGILTFYVFIRATFNNVRIPWRETLTVASVEHPKFGEIARSELEPDDLRIWPMT
jgi:hypothetical protein